MRVLILGMNGQDGAYMAKLCLEQGYSVEGTVRGPKSDLSNLDRLQIKDNVKYHYLEFEALPERFELGEYDIVFNFAAYSSLSVSERDEVKTSLANWHAPKQVFDYLISRNADVRIFQASSMLVFERGENGSRNELYPKKPDTFYGNAKHGLDEELRALRDTDKFAATGILFNHESSLRGDDFVSQKIVRSIAASRIRSGPPVELRSFHHQRDWLHAADVCRAALKIVEHDKADDWIIASGQAHKVLDWVMLSASFAGFVPLLQMSADGLEEVICDASGTVLAKAPRPEGQEENDACVVGDNSKLAVNLNWSPTISFSDMVDEMTTAALDHFK